MDINYGLGISVYESFDQKAFGHDGRINGYIADYLHYEEADVSVIILGNIQTGVADFLRSDIAAMVFKKDFVTKAKSILPGEIGSYDETNIMGTYLFGPNFKVYVERIEGIIQARANEGGSSELLLLADGRYFNRTLYSYIEFKKDASGSIQSMTWTDNNGNSFEGQKE